MLFFATDLSHSLERSWMLFLVPPYLKPRITTSKQEMTEYLHAYLLGGFNLCAPLRNLIKIRSGFQKTCHPQCRDSLRWPISVGHVHWGWRRTGASLGPVGGRKTQTQCQISVGLPMGWTPCSERAHLKAYSRHVDGALALVIVSITAGEMSEKDKKRKLWVDNRDRQGGGAG